MLNLLVPGVVTRVCRETLKDAAAAVGVNKSSVGREL